MACNAVAMATAQVAIDQQVGKYLADEQAKAVLLGQLKAMFGEAVDYSFTALSGVAIAAGGFVVAYSGGRVRVQAQNRNITQAMVDGLTQALGQVLTQAAGLVFQQVVAQAVAQIGFVQSQEYQNGAVVINLEV